MSNIVADIIAECGRKSHSVKNAIRNKKDAMNTTTIPGTDILLLANDQVITPHCLRTGRLDWDRSFLQIPEIANLKSGDVVLDIGAFIGDTTKIFLDKGCVVHAFEAYPDAAHCLKHNCPTAIIYDQPVGDGVSYIAPLGEGGNMGARFCIPNWDGPKTLRIDDLKLPRIDFVKIDVEGFEPFVLDGAKETFQRLHPPIMIEVNWYGYMRYGFKESDILNRLSAMRYRWREVKRADAKLWDAMATA